MKSKFKRAERHTPIVGYIGKFPVVAVEKLRSTETTIVKFWCEHCRTYHTHGAPDGRKFHPGFRAPHCTNPASPLRARDYYLAWNDGRKIPD